VDIAFLGPFLAGVLVGALAVGGALLGIVLIFPWMRVQASGVRVPFLSYLGMRVRRSPPTLIIDAIVALNKAGVRVPIELVETIYLSNKHHVRGVEDLLRFVREQREDPIYPQAV
jgi:uncharacterized protein YqfA (UPF0365 family)